jgi:glycosyltransferase involved in cell wall biosynthesis
MRIGIDARLNAYRGGGIPQYTRQLISALAPLAGSSGDDLIALQHLKQRQPLVAPPPNHLRHATLITPPHHRFEPWSLPAELLRLRLDVLHCPDFIAPLRRPCHAVITIHDLAFMHYPEILDEQAKHYYSQVKTSAEHADAIIAVSQNTRNDICELLKIPPERINVIYEAADPRFKPLRLQAGETRLIGQDLHTKKPCLLEAGSFGLFVSTLEPRKNLSTLLRALRVCMNRRKHTDYRLVVAGGRGWHDEAIFNEVRDLALGTRVVFVGQVAMDDLLWLYNACVFYANPSLYEGFGLPVVEALACGAPTLIADGGSLAEIAGDAALLLPPQDVEAWANALERIWHDEDQQTTLRQLGPPQATRFSWEQTARETLAIYQTLAQKA